MSRFIGAAGAPTYGVPGIPTSKASGGVFLSMYRGKRKVTLDCSRCLAGSTLPYTVAGTHVRYAPGANFNSTVVISPRNGKPYFWGYNSQGPAGNGATTDLTAPISMAPFGSLAAVNKIVAVSSGSTHTLLLDDAGVVHSCGDGVNMGNGTANDTYAPVSLASSGSLAGKSVVAVSVGYQGSSALDSEGGVHTWGGYYGQLGNNTTGTSTVPIRINSYGSLALLAGAGAKVVGLSHGQNTAFAIDSAGGLHGWGVGAGNRLGNNSSTLSNPNPIKISAYGSLASSGAKVVAVSGKFTTFALDDTGVVHAWGAGAAIGNGTNTVAPVPVAISSYGSLAGKTVVMVSAGYSHGMALDSTGGVHTWGYNSYGQLGNDTTDASSVPIMINAFGSLKDRTIVAIKAGTDSCMAVDSDGGVHAWGNNDYGQLGNGNKTRSPVPIMLVDGYDG